MLADGAIEVALTAEEFAQFQNAMTQPSDALKGKSLYDVYGYDKGYGDVIDAITKLGEQF